MKRKLADMPLADRIGWWCDRVIIAPVFLCLAALGVAVTFACAPGLGNFLYNMGLAVLLLIVVLPSLAIIVCFAVFVVEFLPNAAKAIRDSFKPQPIPMTGNNWVASRPIGPTDERL